MAPPRCAAKNRYPMADPLLTIHDLPARLKPREELQRLGVRNVPEDVLLAVLLRSGVRGANVLNVARQLLRQYGTLTELAQCSVEELMGAVRGIGRVKAQVLAAALELARRLNEEQRAPAYRVRTPEDAARLLRDEARLLNKETFWVLHLDAKNGLRGQAERVAVGILDGCLVHPRDVFREAVRRATARTVLVHNHPSGDPTPSAEDIRITRQLLEAGRIVDIAVLDHVILGRAGAAGGRDFLSLREEGIVNFE